MGKRESFPAGTFSWTDLACRDAAAAKKFYGALFDWKFHDDAAGAGVYSQARKDGRAVGALYEMDRARREAGGPAAWTSYVTVDDANASCEQARAAGGSVIAEPFDAMDAGRMAVIAPPGGAVFALWQARSHHGAGLVNEPGSLCWNELNTRDPDGDRAFLTELFGWEFEESADPPYITIKNGERLNGGIVDMRGKVPDEIPAFWNVYFAVADADESVRRAQAAGGTVFVGPVDIPSGRFAVLSDPQHAIFSIIAMNAPDD